MTKPTPPAGTKRVCSSCTAKFYDLGRHPVVCPKCKAELIDPAAIVS